MQPESKNADLMKEGKISIMSLIDNKDFSIATDPETGKPVTTSEAGTTFTFAFDKIYTGEQLVLFNKGRIGNSTDGVTSKQLVLTFNAALKQSDYGRATSVDVALPGFTYSWS
jgi:hypothetical protein